MIVKVKVNNNDDRWAYFECNSLLKLPNSSFEEVQNTFKTTDVYVYADDKDYVSSYILERADKSSAIICFNNYAFLMSESGQTVDKLF